MYGHIVDGEIVLPDYDRYLFSLFIATLELRTPASMDALAYILRWFDTEAKELDVKTLQKAALNFLEPSSHAEYNADKFYKMEWAIINTNSTIGFCTSDHPVVRVNKEHCDLSPWNLPTDILSLDNPDVAIILPLTPKLCFLAQHAGNISIPQTGEFFARCLNAYEFLGCDNLLIGDNQNILKEFLAP